ncbi:hypothetical protein ACOL7R_03355 [Acinetobacter pittii]|uniref:hypothetical protein n=1 Tax=Acinetobacter pittii TaxID=48296 RepID=UPI003BA15793
MVKTKFKTITEANQKKVTKHCAAEIQAWKDIDVKNYTNALQSYFDLSVHLFVELADARAKLARLNKK